MTANEQAQWPPDPSPTRETWWRARGFAAALSGDLTQRIKTSLVRSAAQRPARLAAGRSTSASTARTTRIPARRSCCARSRSRPARSRRTPASGSVVVNDVRKAPTRHGLNAQSGEIEDLVHAGVIDPAIVTRSALQNAASIAKNILTTEAIVAEPPEKDGAAAAACPTGTG